MLKAIFYCRFHPERGPSVVHQYPNNSTVTRSSSGDEPLLSFSDISSYLIPPYDLCNIPLSICSNGFRVLGFPVSLEDSEYERNRFTFNVCFVLDENENARPWQQIVDKTAAFFKEVEEDSGILQAEERLEGLKWAGEVGYPADDVGVVHDLLGTIYEDVNAYGETCVRVDELHVLNLRLSPPKAKAPKVRAWDVPLLIRPLPSSDEWTWDLTLQRIYPQIDGIKHAQRISELADVELKLVKKAVRELLYHERVMLLDLFHFQAIYALTSEFAWFVRDDAAQDECCKYIATDPANNIFKSARQLAAKQQSAEPPSREAVIALYRDLNPGVSLSDFCLINESKLASVDVRRFITFGVIKGFKSNEEAEKEWEQAWKRAAFSSGWATPPREPPAERLDKEVQDVSNVDHGLSVDEEELMQYLDGPHCMDEICVAMHMSEKKVVDKLRTARFGEVIFFCK